MTGIDTLLVFPGMEPLGASMTTRLGSELGAIDVHRFPDGESLVTLPTGLAGKDVAILATLRDPDPLALPLRFAAQTARELGAQRVGLVAPYLGYMRQDRRFASGQAVSAPLFACFLEESFDWLVTADPHLHRIAALSDIFRVPAERMVTAPLIAGWIASHVADPVLVGPDGESRQWVAEVARLAGCPYEVLEKRRSGDRQVDVSAPEQGPLRGRTPVILDDIASSGRTMIRALEQLKAMGTAAPVCLLIHAVFADTAYEDILAAGAAQVVSTDSIPHPSNAISLGPALGDHVKAVLERVAVESRR